MSNLILTPPAGIDYTTWLESIAPADRQQLFDEARLDGPQGSAVAVVHRGSDGLRWMLCAVTEEPRKPRGGPTTVVTTGPPPAPPINPTEPTDPGTPTVVIPPPTASLNPMGWNTAIWQRNNDEQEAGVGSPFVFSGIGDDGPRSGDPDTAPDGTTEAEFFPGGGPNPSLVWSPTARQWVNTPDRTPYLRDTWGIRSTRIATVADAAGLSPATSSYDTIQASRSFSAAGVRSVISTWDATGKDEMPWNLTGSTDYWERVMRDTAEDRLVWWNFNNEPYTGLSTDDRWKAISQYWLGVARQRSFSNDVILDLGVWGQDLGSVALGLLDEWRDEMEAAGLWSDRVHVGWHAYGANPVANQSYTYQDMAEHLDQASRRGWSVFLGEFGQTETVLAEPKAGLDSANRSAVDFLLGGDDGPSLAKAYGLIPHPWIGSGDTTRKCEFKICKGAEFGDHKARPLWQISERNAASDLTDFGQKLWGYRTA